MAYRLKLLVLVYFVKILALNHVKCSTEEERLVKNLFTGYNKLIRPVLNSSDHVLIKMDLVLLQLINVYEKEQIMKTNVWINLKWTDFQLKWSSNDYKVGSIRVPCDRTWTPDIVLFNNADGNYEASFKSNIVLYADTDEDNVVWIPPAIYKSSCTIDVRYFPFDEQRCEMRFGSWTFDAHQVRLLREKPKANLEDYLPSGTWDVIDAEAKEYEFSVDQTKRMELIYVFTIRRKTLFYTVNLIIPTVLISFLSIFVFYLPTDEGEKMTLCISILLALVVFLLLVSKILPPTSMVIPLISKYLIFTLIMNIVTILNTVIIINWNYRTPRTHNMPHWVRIVFIDFLPKVLFMQRPEQEDDKEEEAESGTAKARANTTNSNSNSDLENNYHSDNDTETKLNHPTDKLLISKSKENILEKENEFSGGGGGVGGSRTSTLKKSNYMGASAQGSNEYAKDSPSITVVASGMVPPSSSSLYNLQAPSLMNSHLANSAFSRPKQQQHLNLDKLAAKIGSNSKKSNHLSPMHDKYKHSISYMDASLSQKNQQKTPGKSTYKSFYETDTDEVTDEKSKRNRLATLSATDTNQHQQTPNRGEEREHRHRHHHHGHHRHHHHHHHKHHHRHKHDREQSALEALLSNQTQMSVINRTGSSRTRRNQYMQKQSYSLEYPYDDSMYTSDDDKPIEFSSEILEAADKVSYITNHIKSENDYQEVRDDWKYVALVIDRLQLYIFFSVTVIGTAYILFNAPHIFEFVDQQQVLRKLKSENVPFTI